MTSREIADLLECRHDNVKVTIERLIDRGVIVEPAMQDVPFTDSLGRVRSERAYKVCKRDSYIVVAQLSPEFTAALVDRWEALEAQAATPVAPAIPNFNNPAEAARAWALQYEEAEEAKAQTQVAMADELSKGGIPHLPAAAHMGPA